MRWNLSPAREKLIITAACVAGAGLTAYGMIMKNNPVFLVGIATVIGAYLAIRKKLRAALQGKNTP